MEVGCTRTISALDPKLVETVKDWTQGGVDFAFEISGAKPAMASANAITRKGGEIICVGLGASTEMYQYAHAALVGEEKAFRGSFMGTGIVERDLPRYLKYYQDGRMPVDRLKSGTMTFDQLNHNLDLLDRGENARAKALLPNG
jgi:alcohol dehydrogenase